MRKQDLAKVAAYAAVFGLVGGVTFEGVNYTANHFIGSAAVESTATRLQQEAVMEAPKVYPQ